MVGRKGVKSEELKLQCEWSQCGNIYIDLGEFYQHLAYHYHVDFEVNQGTGGDLCCTWKECTFFTNCKEDMLRHIYFHGYHTKVKWWGLLCHQKLRLGQCKALQGRNVIPELPDGYKCEWKDCGMVWDVPDQFYLHVNDHAHFAEQETLSGDTKGLRCYWEGCTYVYLGDKKARITGSRFKLRDHLRTHTKERAYACPWCGNLYVNKTKFADHFDRQTSVECHCFQCTHCSRTFSTERLLKDHMRHHVNHYKCPKCAMTCPNPSGLKHHMRYKHNDDRPFACQYCPYKSKTAYDLQVHTNFHRSDLTYKCHVEGCDYAVRSLQSLRYHFRTKHLTGRDKCYVCHLCDKRFSVGFMLTHHLRKAHNFQWPPGHSRFRYKEGEDGLFRLQTYRFESVELTEQLMVGDQSTPSGSATEILAQPANPGPKLKKISRKKKKAITPAAKRFTRSATARLRAEDGRKAPRATNRRNLITIGAATASSSSRRTAQEASGSAESAGSSRDLENFPSLSKRRRGRSKPLSPIQDNRQSDGGVAGGCGPDEAPASGAWRDDVGGVVDYVAEGQVAPKAESSTSHPANADTHPGPERTSSPPWPASQPVPGPTSAGGARKATRLVIVNLGTSAADLKERSRQKNAAAREAAAEEGSSSQVGMDKADDTCQVSVVDGRLATDDAGKPVSVKVGGKDYYLVRAKDADGKNTSFCLVAAEDYQKRSAE